MKSWNQSAVTIIFWAATDSLFLPLRRIKTIDNIENAHRMWINIWKEKKWVEYDHIVLQNGKKSP